MVKTIKKIIIATIVMALATTAILYETYSITKKEYERQVEVADSVRKNVTLNLNMVKIAVQTNDEDTYAENLVKMENEVRKLDDLTFIENPLSGYKARLKYYTELLESKKELLPEIKNLKTRINEITTAIKDGFVSTGITREKVREVNPTLNNLKIDTNLFTNEKTKSVVVAVNGILDEMAASGTTISGCIDTCYKNRITELTNGINDKIKAFSDSTAQLNLNVEEEFELQVLADLQ